MPTPPASNAQKSIPGIPPREIEAASAPSDAGANEALQLASGRSESDLRRQALTRDHERSEDFKDHFEYVAVGGLYLMAFGVVGFAFVWAFHVLAPTSWRWLDSDQVDRIQNLVTGGVLAGLIADQFRRRLGGR